MPAPGDLARRGLRARELIARPDRLRASPRHLRCSRSSQRPRISLRSSADRLSAPPRHVSRARVGDSLVRRQRVPSASAIAGRVVRAERVERTLICHRSAAPNSWSEPGARADRVFREFGSPQDGPTSFVSLWPVRDLPSHGRMPPRRRPGSASHDGRELPGHAAQGRPTVSAVVAGDRRRLRAGHAARFRRDSSRRSAPTTRFGEASSQSCRAAIAMRPHRLDPSLAVDLPRTGPAIRRRRASRPPSARRSDDTPALGAARPHGPLRHDPSARSQVPRRAALETPDGRLETTR